MSEDHNAPSPYSTINPNLQLAWDATSLAALQKCPRYYKYAMLDGWRPKGGAVDLDFGIMFASAVETFHKSRLEGLTKDEAMVTALRKVLHDSWIDHGDHGHPWGESYETMWRCTGTEKYKNKAGNNAKCPWSHKGKWFMGDSPHTCGECGSPTHTERRWLPNDANKNRHTLVRLLAAYCDDQPEHLDQPGGLKPYAFPDGTPAIELSFKLPLPFKSCHGEQFIAAGHLDSIKYDGFEHFVSDNKTTKKALTSAYWRQFNPNVQVQYYDLFGSLLFPDLNLKGVAIEAAQVLVGSVEFGMQVFKYNEAQREETLSEIEHWLKMAETFAEQGYWPQNRTACNFCVFNSICAREPGKREMFLKADFVQVRWNPLAER